MKACILNQRKPITERPLRYVDVDTPAPGAGEVLIKVRACGVCRTDLHVIEGELDPRKGVLPVIPGHQIVGEVVELGQGAAGIVPGDRVGVAWLHCTCGGCRFCASQRENLCENAEFTGWTRQGGFAEYVVAPADFVYPLPQALEDHQVAPLLCAGIIGYRCIRQCGIDDWNGAKLGLYGFGAAGHIAIQIARFRGADVYVCTRDRDRHQKLAEELGAAWVGGTVDPPPVKLDASIIFAPAGEIIPPALEALDRGGTLVCGGIYMSPSPPIKYELLYQERAIRSVANNTRADGRDFLEEAARTGVKTHTQLFKLEEANEALIALKHDAIRGEAVLVV
ncbi:MAG: zinc-dependent alcohol dehydrogenase family protein [Phycisphaerales bacterium]|nr:MAG: zinc-dependent alcohol dehydrogenase family protein [Phycisphaerales bacterium]